MHDLATIRLGDFGPPEASTGVVLLHLGFRTIWRKAPRRLMYASHFPALGLLSLGQSIRHESSQGAFVMPSLRYFDEEDFDDLDAVREAVVEWLEPFARRLVAASCYSVSVGILQEFFSGLDPERHLLIVGGAHPTVAPQFSAAHIVVRGEGAAAMCHILRTAFSPEFEKGVDAKGICYLEHGSARNSTPGFDRSLATIPSPAFAYDLHRPRRVPRYWTHFTRAVGPEPQIYICTQSCRARCSFCSTYLIHGKAVYRPAELVRQDLHGLVNVEGFGSIEFHDDDLLQHGELEGVLDAMSSTGAPWFCYGRVDTLESTIARSFANAGCRRIFLGLEAMNQQTLDYFNKRTTVEQNVTAVEACFRAGIGVIGAFILGAPHHTVESILEDLDRLLALPLFALRASILSPDIGTREFQRARRKEPSPFAGLKMSGVGKSLSVSPDTQRFGTATPFGMPTVCEHVSKKTLNVLLNLVYCEFYLRSPVAVRLIDETPREYHPVIREFYRGLRRTLDELVLTAGDPLIQERAVRLASSKSYAACETIGGG